MKKICFLLFSVFMLVSVSTAPGQSSQDDIAESNQQFEQWSKSLAEFVKDVRFNEEDVKSFLSLADDFNSFGAEDDDEAGEYLDFSTILNDEDYLAWAKSKGINSDKWLKKTMRIIAVMMRTEMEANISGEPFDMKAQMAELEEMRAQMGEEQYQQMKQALAAGSAAMEGMEEAYKHLPVPTDAEKALLAKYKDQLMNLE